MRIIISLMVSIFAASFSTVATSQEIDWQKVDDAFGRKPAAVSGDVHRYGFPRTDLAVTLGKPFTIYGDGKQVRDVLWVEDLVDVYDLALQNIDRVKGRIFNMGGGPERQLSLLELIELLDALSAVSINFVSAVLE